MSEFIGETPRPHRADVESAPGATVCFSTTRSLCRGLGSRRSSWRLPR